MTNLTTLLADKSLKPKDKTEFISQSILEGSLKLDELIAFAKTQKDPAKATCIEAIEFATKQNPDISNKECFAFVSETLTAKAPRVKWESAKVIGNIARLYTTHLDEAIKNLLVNTEHEGTVVRWSAAFALGEIVKLKTAHNQKLIPAIESICLREEKNSIKKIYMAALKYIQK
ncbi:MAG: HEAT repeat domain-containing protein [Bacteroidetes bacterium]|nr:HEAT repeat domain-containing protein [Bacteroidota bacterium]